MEGPPLEGLRTVAGQSAATELLLRAVRNDRLASAYLFEGPHGVGKERAARALAQATVCTARRDDGDACGQCPTCRQVATGVHVDVITLAREIDLLSQAPHRAADVKSEIVVEKVRQLQSERLAFHSHQGARWVIVRDAHELNQAASNALLKTLEEPPAQTHFVLVTSQPARLLTTIRSRCQRIRFRALPADVVEHLLVASGTDATLASECAKLADGSLTAALELTDPEKLSARRAWVERFLTALRAGRPGAYVDVAEALRDLAKNDEPQAIAVVQMLEGHFRDEALRSVADDRRRATASAARADLVRATLESLGRNLNLQMAVESMLIRLRDIRG